MQHMREIDEALNLFAPGQWIIGDDEGEPREFEPPVDVFPVFSRALVYYQDRAPGHAVQFDTVAGYEQMIGSGRFDTVCGVVDDAPNARCYHDDDCVFVSILFMLPDGSERVATSAARPMGDEAFQGWGEILGSDPVAFLAMYPEASRAAIGKRLLVSASDAVRNHPASELTDVSGPVLVRGLSSDTAPLAALIYLMQRAQHGDQQAAAELAIMQGASETPLGQKVAAPVLAEAAKRLKDAQR